MQRLSTLLAAVAFATLAAPLADAGPPAVCHPIHTKADVGMPWGGSGWNEVARDTAPEVAVERSLLLLAKTDDTFAHMEIIRRTVVYLSGYGKGLGKNKRKDLARKFVEALRQDGKELAVKSARDAELIPKAALRRFDAAYATSALDQVGIDVEGDVTRDLDAAMKVRSKDAAMRVGAALAIWTARDGERRACAYLENDLRSLSKASLQNHG